MYTRFRSGSFRPVRFLLVAVLGPGPALMAGVAGLITLQGAPESHLGILSREFGIPCVMTTQFDEGVQTERGETIPADGTTVRLDISGDQGQVFLVAG